MYLNDHKSNPNLKYDDSISKNKSELLFKDLIVWVSIGSFIKYRLIILKLWMVVDTW